MKTFTVSPSVIAVALLAALAASGVATQSTHKKPKTKKPVAVVVHYAQVQKILTVNCVKCHAGEKPRAGIDLQSMAGVMKGGEDGPIVVAGKPADSVLVKAMKGEGARLMPPRGPKMSDADIKMVEGWIKGGAKA